MVGGKAVYGDPLIMEQLTRRDTTLESFEICGIQKRISFMEELKENIAFIKRKQCLLQHSATEVVHSVPFQTVELENRHQNIGQLDINHDPLEVILNSSRMNRIHLKLIFDGEKVS